MQLTRAADYGVRVMMHMVTDAAGSRASLTELAESADVSPAFLSKVLQRLVRAGLLASRRGKRGGFELLEKGRAASMYEVLDALDGLPALNACLLNGGCHRSPWCAAHEVWAATQEQMRETLRQTRLEPLAWESHRRRLSLAGRKAEGQGGDGNGAGGSGDGNRAGGSGDCGSGGECDGWYPAES